jgi:DNA polymerase I-like protein with 3'-5' exonuclease and polymerase domains
LEGLSVVTHRAGYLKGFLEKVDENGYAVAFAHGFTKTLRLKHAKPFVNLPKPTSPYGDLVRGVMIAPEGSILVGSDVSSLEDKMKQISIYPYDPEYVEDMNRPGYDAHLDIGLRSGMISQDESDFFRWYKKKDKKREDLPESFKSYSDEDLSVQFEEITKKRAVAKTVNYACVYGAGVAKIAESSSLPQKDAKKLHAGYWDRNWSVKKYAEDQKVKNVEGKSWIWNPITNFYYFLASEKDRFSACNQSAGVRVFDGYVYEMIKRGVRPIFQAHDEVLLRVKEEDVESTTKALRESIKKVNAQYKFPVEIEVDIQTGKTYADVH